MWDFTTLIHATAHKLLYQYIILANSYALLLHVTFLWCRRQPSVRRPNSSWVVICGTNWFRWWTGSSSSSPRGPKHTCSHTSASSGVATCSALSVQSSGGFVRLLPARRTHSTRSSFRCSFDSSIKVLWILLWFCVCTSVFSRYSMYFSTCIRRVFTLVLYKIM